MYRELREEVGLEARRRRGARRHDWTGCATGSARQVRAAQQHAAVHGPEAALVHAAALEIVAHGEECDSTSAISPNSTGRWVDFWRPVNEVIYFKRRVYARALHELGSTVYPKGLPPRPRWWPKRWRAVFDKDIRRLVAKGDAD